jgi:hemolysin III
MTVPVVAAGEDRPMRARSTVVFPRYTAGEAALDRALHVVGVSLALAATAWLIATVPIASVAIYCLGALGGLGASAAYHLTAPGGAKLVLRRVDHAMIFVTIAGCYTPFTLAALPPPSIAPLLVGGIWVLAAVGCWLKLAAVRCGPRTDLALYLGLGWLPLPWFVTTIPTEPLALLIGGGLAYSLGAVVHARSRWRFHNALWHALVLVGATLHFIAITRLVGAA